jgi:hypothetical protein
MPNSNLWIKGRIPHCSRLEIGVRPGEAPISCRAFVERDGTEIAQWRDSELRPGPKFSGPIECDSNYIIRVAVQFAGTGNAQIIALVRKRDGNIYGGTYRYRFQGNAGDTVIAHLILVAEPCTGNEEPCGGAEDDN